MKYLPAGITRYIWPLIIAGLIQGCMVGPDYTRPAVPMQNGWQEAKSTAAALQPEDVRWWRDLEDPQLVNYIEKGISGNQNIKEAEARVREARAQRGVAVAGLLPQVDGGALFNRSLTSSTAGIISELPKNLIKEVNFEQNLFQAGFDASWELDIFGGRRREVQAASARAQSSIENHRDVMISVIAEIARNYVELRGAQRQLAIAEKNSDIQEKTLFLVKIRQDAKITSDLEVEQAKAQLERTRGSIPPLQASIRGSAYQLGVLTGQPPNALLDDLLATSPIPNPPDIVPVGLPSDLLLRRPDLRRAETDLRAATSDIGSSTADLYPRFYLTGYAEPQSAKFSDLFRAHSFAWSIGPTISWPVFHGGKILSNIAATEARRDEALARYRQAVLTAMQEVETSLVGYAEHQVERERLALSVESQSRAVELARERYERGIKDFLTVLDAERQLRDVENSLALSETQVLVNLISLYKALGGGWQQTDVSAHIGDNRS
jgi:NodT family efflux transporter outer membrane factor (OMF) lipoprotein